MQLASSARTRNGLALAERDEPRGRDPSGTIGRNIEPFLLFELLRAPSYGYDLIRRLSDYGFRRATAEPGVVYKVLRSLEDAGSIRSEWSPRESGPARRYYEITDSGREVLGRRLYHLRRYLDRVEKLVAAYIDITGDELPGDQFADELESPAPGRGAPLPIGEGRDPVVAAAAGPGRGS